MATQVVNEPPPFSIFGGEVCMIVNKNYSKYSRQPILNQEGGLDDQEGVLISTFTLVSSAK